MTLVILMISTNVLNVKVIIENLYKITAIASKISLKMVQKTVNNVKTPVKTAQVKISVNLVFRTPLD